MKPVSKVACLVFVTGCAQPGGAGGRGEYGGVGESSDLVLGEHALDAFHLPEVADKRFVRVGEVGPMLLLEDTEDHFTVFDGFRERSHAKDDPEDPAKFDDQTAQLFAGHRQGEKSSPDRQSEIDGYAVRRTSQ